MGISFEQLPNEIWLDILHFATLHPLDPDYSLTCTRRSIYLTSFGIGTGWRLVLYTRRSVVQVSWEWYHLAISYLYQSIPLESLTRETYLICTFKSNKRLAALVKRVWFNAPQSFPPLHIDSWILP